MRPPPQGTASAARSLITPEACSLAHTRPPSSAESSPSLSHSLSLSDDMLRQGASATPLFPRAPRHRHRPDAGPVSALSGTADSHSCFAAAASLSFSPSSPRGDSASRPARPGCARSARSRMRTCALVQRLSCSLRFADGLRRETRPVAGRRAGSVNSGLRRSERILSSVENGGRRAE